ncbi:MAG: A/G-specific adenine glycosylase [Flavobacteriales bacterium CG_4_10_14_0_2_um_filter_32_8]|nr:MAG: A/G-specific adenine glycosylase [Flavobacteriales bacterium CG_4_10_14_0_2_um_filter_32_8]
MGFSTQLISWYQDNKRDLPWRNSKDAYVIWLSEIILQQTRVAQGLSYFNNFINKYPTIIDLANASEQDVLNLWQGLGYYSRARNLHFTAKYITNTYKGVFPKKYDDILKLKGVGEYTAAAITSFTYNKCFPVIDGNVFRVLSRIFGIEEPIDSKNGKKIFKDLATDLIDKKNPSVYNQAIMEFGALQCIPKNPNCENCRFILMCYAFKNKKIHLLPYKEKKIKQRNRYFNYLVLFTKNEIFLTKRNENDIWNGLYDFPLIETEQSIEFFEELYSINQNNNFISPTTFLISKSKEYKHILSHQKIYATFWVVSGIFKNKAAKTCVKCSIKDINKYPVPKLIENYLKTLF